jgi:hypothetical protein
MSPRRSAVDLAPGLRTPVRWCLVQLEKQRSSFDSITSQEWIPRGDSPSQHSLSDAEERRAPRRGWQGSVRALLTN